MVLSAIGDWLEPAEALIIVTASPRARSTHRLSRHGIDRGMSYRGHILSRHVLHHWSCINGSCIMSSIMCCINEVFVRCTEQVTCPARPSSRYGREWKRAVIFVGTLAVAAPMLVLPAVAAGDVAPGPSPVEPIQLLGVPIDFILFGLTLAGVAVFHHYTLTVALTGLALITAYKLAFTGFKFGLGFAGLALHLQHEWVILANLFLLLMGFALLSRHFEASRVPDEMPAFLPDDWKGGLALLAIVFVMSALSRQHRRRTDRRHDGAARFPRQGPHRLPGCHRGGIERRRRRQRRRRYHDHHDVDRRGQPVGGFAGLCGGRDRAADLRHSGIAPAAELFAHRQSSRRSAWRSSGRAWLSSRRS